jgi:hypothetical protein
MNLEPENSSSSPGSDPLDQLLNEARWPAATPNHVARSAEHWHAVWRTQRRREWLAFRAAVVGVAASLLVAVLFGWSWFNRRGNELPQPVTVKQPQEPPIREKNPPPVKQPVKQMDIPRIALRPASSSPHFAEPVLSRAPSKLEEMLVAAQGRGRRDRKYESHARPSVPETAASPIATAHPSVKRRPTAKARTEKDAASAAVARLVSDPKLDVTKVAAELPSALAANESRLLAILANAPVAEQTAAVRLLAEIGTPRSVPDLLRASTDSNLHVAAINALLRLADSATLDQLASAETSRDLQRSLLAALLERGDLESFRFYSAYLQSEATAETALAAAEQTPNPPTEILFASLRSPSELERLAAARVLGRIDGPATTERLVAMLEEGTSRQEACVALLSSRGQEAVNFVNSARTNPALAASFQAASVLASTNSPPRS